MSREALYRSASPVSNETSVSHDVRIARRPYRLIPVSHEVPYLSEPSEVDPRGPFYGACGVSSFVSVMSIASITSNSRSG